MVNNHISIMVLVPFSAVDHGVPFRYKRKWWRKRYGSINFAITTQNPAGKISELQRFDEKNDVVAIYKKDMVKTRFFEVIKEVKIEPKTKSKK